MLLLLKAKERAISPIIELTYVESFWVIAIGNHDQAMVDLDFVAVKQNWLSAHLFHLNQSAV